MITDFIYNDIVLYCKGWYQKNGNMLEDLGYLFSKIYAWTPKTEKEIGHMMLIVLDKLYDGLDKPINSYRFYNKHSIFMEEISKYMSLYEISMDMAIIYLVRGILQGLSQDEIKLKAPHYGKKEYFRMGSLFGINPISMTYTEMNRRAQKVFSK